MAVFLALQDMVDQPYRIVLIRLSLFNISQIGATGLIGYCTPHEVIMELVHWHGSGLLDKSNFVYVCQETRSEVAFVQEKTFTCHVVQVLTNDAVSECRESCMHSAIFERYSDKLNSH